MLVFGKDFVFARNKSFLCVCLPLAALLCNWEQFTQASKQASKQANKQASKQESKQASKQADAEDAADANENKQPKHTSMQAS